VDPGHHVLKARTETGAGDQEIDIAEGEQKLVELELTAIAASPAPVPALAPSPAEPETLPKVHSPTALTIVGMAAFGAGVLVGSVTGLVSLSKKSTLTTECPNRICGPSSYSTLDSANALATVSDVSFAVAGAGAVLAIVTLVVGHTPAPAASVSPSSGWTLAPWIAGAEAGVRGSF
jgi:hypothetical protein